MTSAFHTLDKLERLAGEIGDLQSKLILLVGNGGKTRLLRALAQRLNAAPFNVGVKLGHRLAATPVSERGFSVNGLLRDVTDSARGNVLVDKTKSGDYSMPRAKAASLVL